MKQERACGQHSAHYLGDKQPADSFKVMGTLQYNIGMQCGASGIHRSVFII